MAEYKGLGFDFVSFSLAFGAFFFIGYEMYLVGMEMSMELLMVNPLLGGDPTLGRVLPLWTYMIGHILPGAVFQILGAILATLISREWQYGKRHDARAFFLTLIALGGSAPLLAPFHKVLYERTHGQLYFDINQYSLYWVFCSIVLALFITETWFYWIHRALHQKHLYKYIHGVHHSFNPSTSSCASAFHPLDIVILTLGAVFVPILIPIHNGVYTGILLVNLVFTIIQHTANRISFGCGVFNDANLHNIHHDYGMAPRNCGSLMCFWDRIGGTYEPNTPRWVKKPQVTKPLKTKRG